jgi:hypothetical protein
MVPRQSPEVTVSCSQHQRTSTLLGRWAAEWPRLQQNYGADQFARWWTGKKSAQRSRAHEGGSGRSTPHRALIPKVLVQWPSGPSDSQNGEKSVC